MYGSSRDAGMTCRWAVDRGDGVLNPCRLKRHRGRKKIVLIPSSSLRLEDLDAVLGPPADRIRRVSAPHFTNYGKGVLATQMHLLKKGII